MRNGVRKYANCSMRLAEHAESCPFRRWHGERDLDGSGGGVGGVYVAAAAAGEPPPVGGVELGGPGDVGIEERVGGVDGPVGFDEVGESLAGFGDGAAGEFAGFGEFPVAFAGPLVVSGGERAEDGGECGGGPGG